MASCVQEFPTWALVPKKETGVVSFLSKYPQYDGRGIRIAIFDSGVDPGAPGLQVTSNGKPKIIDMIDATGAGDVDTSTVVEAKDGKITGLSGKVFDIPETWENPSGKYHIGLKNLYEFYPKSLKERLMRHYKENNWDPFHKKAFADEQRKLKKYEDKNTSTMSMDERLDKEDIEMRIEILNTLEKKFLDNGPVADCIVFHDKEMWRAVVDTSEDGDLKNCTLLGNYKQTHKYATISEISLYNYVVNIYDDGNLLEIVGMSTAHGTHVASIAAACFPDHPEKNGIAPGAQIVSIGIGDSRLGSMETGSALVRAVIKVMETECNVINMSYGEHAHWSGGRVMDILHEVVDTRAVVMVSSAGNNGPALSTVGTPPMMPTTSIIGVGAYVSPDMMIADYSLRERMPGNGYTWTSRGPTLDGHMGVSITAPGGAITSVPKWTLKSGQLMNGTSMSSPHVAGSIALMLSAAKPQIWWSPYSVRRSLENTARQIPNMDVFGQGHGLLQVDKAWEHLSDTADCMEREVRFQITCNGGKRGIYLREPLSAEHASDHTITVEPIFLDDTSIFYDPDTQIRAEFDMTFSMVCEAPWISTAQHLHLTYASRVFGVHIEPRSLAYGQAHHTTIKAFDSNCPDKGPVFEVPITVIKPVKVEDCVSWTMWYNDIHFSPGEVHREFIYVPEGATYAVVRLQLLDEDKSSHFVIHAIQLRPLKSSRCHEFYKVVNLNDQSESVQSFPVQGGGTLELCIAKWWASIANARIKFSIKFCGLQPNQPNIIMHAADAVHRIDVMSHLRAEDLSPQVILKWIVMPVRPSEHKIQPLGKRDVLPKNRVIYELVLTYNFTIAKSCDVSPNCSFLTDLLYESEFESQLWMLFDTNKQLLVVGDTDSSKYVSKLDKGDYVLRLQVRHEKKELLDKLTETVVLIQQKLSSSINLEVYASRSAAMIGSKKFSSYTLYPSSICPLFIAPIPSEKLPKIAQPGHYLQGTITYAKDELGRKADPYDFKYVITELAKKPPKTNSDKNKDKTKEEEYEEAVRDLKIAWISKIENGGAPIFEELKPKYGDHLPLLSARIAAMDNDMNNKSQSKEEKLNALIALADQIIGAIDMTALLAYYGMKNDVRKDAASIKSSMDKQKVALIEALARKGCALCDLYDRNHGDAVTSSNDQTNTSEDQLQQINNIYVQLFQLTEHNDARVQLFLGRHACVHERYGRAIKCIMKSLDEKPTIELESKIIMLFKHLGWIHCSSHMERSQLVRFPPSYRLF